MPQLNLLCSCHSFGWCVGVDAIMDLLRCLFGVAVCVILDCDITAGRQHPPQQSNVLPLVSSFDKCLVEEGQKIRCGTPDVTAEQCGEINCCFDGSQCFYGKAGGCSLASLCFWGCCSYLVNCNPAFVFHSSSDRTVYQRWPVCGGCVSGCYLAAYGSGVDQPA